MAGIFAPVSPIDPSGLVEGGRLMAMTDGQTLIRQTRKDIELYYGNVNIPNGGVVWGTNIFNEIRTLANVEHKVMGYCGNGVLYLDTSDPNYPVIRSTVTTAIDNVPCMLFHGVLPNFPYNVGQGSVPNDAQWWDIALSQGWINSINVVNNESYSSLSTQIFAIRLTITIITNYPFMQAGQFLYAGTPLINANIGTQSYTVNINGTDVTPQGNIHLINSNTGTVQVRVDYGGTSYGDTRALSFLYPTGQTPALGDLIIISGGGVLV